MARYSSGCNQTWRLWGWNIEETLDDAVDMAFRNQEDAGIDIITDGEMRRLRFFTVGFHERLSGLTALDPFRSWWS